MEQCTVSNLYDPYLPQGYGVGHLAFLNLRVPQTGVLGEFRGWI